MSQVEVNIPLDSLQLVHEGRRLTDDKKTLKDLGVKENDVLFVDSSPPPAAAGAGPGPGASVAEQCECYIGQ